MSGEPGARARWLALAAAPAALLGWVLVAPLLRLLWAGFAGEFAGAVPEPAVGWLQPWQDPYLRTRLLWSLAQAGITCVLALLLGLPLAWLLARLAFWGRSAVLRLLMLPFVVPTLVAALGVLALAGPGGVLAPWLGPHLQDSPWLLLYGNLFFNLCLVVRAGVEGLERVNAHQLAAARSLGASPWRAFWRVEWPVAAGSLMSALCLVFLYCFSSFGLALVLGGPRWATAEVEVYTLVAHELRLHSASVLACWLMAMGAAVTGLYALLERAHGAPQGVRPVPRQPPRGLLQWVALGTGLWVLGAVCAAPLLAIAWRVAGAQVDVVALWRDEEVRLALTNTLRFAGVTLVLATGLGVLHALAGRTGVAWRGVAFLPFVVSPVTVAFGLLLLYPAAAGSLLLLLGAYTLLAYPFVAKALAAGLDALPPSPLWAARTLGASRWRCFWRVTLPLLAPALRRGMAFALATALGEFAVTLFLSRPEWTTLTTLIYQRLAHPGAQSLDEALVLALVLMALALLAFVAVEGRGDPAGTVRHA
ncbi:MAG: iron ABC transporter permease [Rhodoferax sp.]